MGDEVLEEAEFEHFMEGISDKISGKKVALFGSYGWERWSMDERLARQSRIFRLHINR